MNKILFILSVVGASVGTAAFAQSRVVLEGVIDVGVQRLSGGGTGHVTNLSNSGLTTSRLIFRGVEDLGGGLNAGFWLEAGLNPDEGTGRATNTNNQAGGVAGGGAIVFDRRSYVSLGDRWGELRLGRDFVPMQYMNINYDAFNTNGIGRIGNLTYAAAGNGPLPTTIVASNSLSYWTPAGLGGFYGHAMAAIGENNSTAANRGDGDMHGLRVGYAVGSFDISAGYDRTKYVSTAALGDYTNSAIGATWDAQVAKVYVLYSNAKVQLSTGTVKKGVAAIGVRVPVGATVLRASYARLDDRSSSTLRNSDRSAREMNDASQIAVGFIHNLSKRTAVYGTYAHLSNKGRGTYTLSGGVTPAAGRTSKGVEFGLRHIF